MATLDPGRSMQLEAYGNWLREQRLAAGLSSKRASALADLHPVHWSRMENGQSGTERSTLPRILSAIGIGPADPRYAEAFGLLGFPVLYDAEHEMVAEGAIVKFSKPNSGTVSPDGNVFFGPATLIGNPEELDIPEFLKARPLHNDSSAPNVLVREPEGLPELTYEPDEDELAQVWAFYEGVPPSTRKEVLDKLRSEYMKAKTKGVIGKRSE